MRKRRQALRRSLEALAALAAGADAIKCFPLESVPPAAFEKPSVLYLPAHVICLAGRWCSGEYEVLSRRRCEWFWSGSEFVSGWRF